MFSISQVLPEQLIRLLRQKTCTKKKALHFAGKQAKISLIKRL